MSWWTSHRGKVLGAVATVVGAYFGYPALGAVVGKALAEPAAGEPAPYGPTESGGNISPTTLPTVTTSAKGTGTDWGGVIGGLAGGATSLYGQSQANAANAQQARQQMEFQASQTGTSYQRGVADMKAAGLNPMLAYSQGGASSGSGAQATMGNATAPAVSSAFQGLQTLAGLGLTKAQIENTNAASDKATADTDFVRSQTAMQDIRSAQIIADTQGSIASARRSAADTRDIEERIPGTRARSGFEVGSLSSRLATAAAESRSADLDAKLKGLGVNKADAYSKFYGSSAGKAEPYISLVGDTASSAIGALSGIKNLRRPFPTLRK